MPTITIKPELYSRIEKVASEHKANVNEILNQAIQHYLSELEHLNSAEQRLEKAAASGSRQTFHNAISSIDWAAAVPDQFILAIDLALELGDITLATELATQGNQWFPDNPILQRAAQTVAPSKVTIGHHSPVRSLDASLEWFEQNATAYKGQWVAVKCGKLIGTASSRRDLTPVLDAQNLLADVLVAQVS